MDVTTETFEQEVVHRSRELPVVVDFWAEWCGPCRMLGPVLEREAEQRTGELVLAKVDVDANPDLADRFGIQGIPAVKAFRNGNVVAEFVGVKPPQTVADFLDALTGPTATERAIAELRESGELPDVLAALTEADYERALQLLLDAVRASDDGMRERLVKLAVSFFGELGDEHPLTLRYRRQLAATLY